MIFISSEKNVCHFLLVINSNLGPISHRFRDMATYILKFYTKSCFQTPAHGDMVTIDSLYRTSPAPYPIIQLPTPYDLPCSRNRLTSVTDRETTTTMPVAHPLVKYDRLAIAYT